MTYKQVRQFFIKIGEIPYAEKGQKTRNRYRPTDRNGDNLGVSFLSKQFTE